jgi:hypothetical protein
MPYRQNISYKNFHVAAAATKQAAGMLFDGTSNSTIAGAGSASFTLHTRTDGDPGWIGVGARLTIDVGGGVAEIVTVTNVSGPSGALDTAASPYTITATFAFAHSSGFAVRYTRGTRLNTVNFGGLGTAMTLTLFNGHPDIASSSTIAVITPANQPFEFLGSDVDGGLFYTYAGTTAGDLTISAVPIPF